MEKNFVLRFRGNWEWVKFYFSNKLSQKKKKSHFPRVPTGLVYWYCWYDWSYLLVLQVWSTGTTGLVYWYYWYHWSIGTTGTLVLLVYCPDLLVY